MIHGAPQTAVKSVQFCVVDKKTGKQVGRRYLNEKPRECEVMRNVQAPKKGNKYTLSPTVDESLMIHDARFFVVLNVTNSFGTSILYQTPEIVIDQTPPTPGKVLTWKLVEEYEIINDPRRGIVNQKGDRLNWWRVEDVREINETRARGVISGFTDKEASLMMKYVVHLEILGAKKKIVETENLILPPGSWRLPATKIHFSFKYKLEHNTRWRCIVTGYSRVNRKVDQASAMSVVDVKPPVCTHTGGEKNPLLYKDVVPYHWSHMLTCTDDLARADPKDSGIVQVDVGIGFGPKRDDVIPFTKLSIKVSKVSKLTCVLVPPKDTDSKYELCKLTLSAKQFSRLVQYVPYFVSIRIWDRAGNNKVYYSHRVFVSGKPVQAYTSRFFNRISYPKANPPKIFNSDTLYLHDPSRLPVSFIGAFMDFEAMEIGLGGAGPEGSNYYAVVKYSYYVNSPDDPKYTKKHCVDNYENGKLNNCGTLMGALYNHSNAVHYVTGLTLNENKRYQVCMRATGLAGTVSRWLCPYAALVDTRPPGDFKITMPLSQAGLKGNVQGDGYKSAVRTLDEKFIIDEASGVKEIRACLYQANPTGHILNGADGKPGAEECTVVGPKSKGSFLKMPVPKNKIHGKTFVGCLDAIDFAGYSRKRCGAPVTVDLTGPKVEIKWINQPSYITDTSKQFTAKIAWSVKEDYSKIKTVEVCVGMFPGKCDIVKMVQVYKLADNKETKGETILKWNAKHGESYYAYVRAVNTLALEDSASTTKIQCDSKPPQTMSYLVEGPQGKNPSFQQMTTGVLASWIKFNDGVGTGIKDYELQLFARPVAERVYRLKQDMQAHPLAGNMGSHYLFAYAYPIPQDSHSE